MRRVTASGVGLVLLVATSQAAAEEWPRSRISRLPDSAFAAVETASDGRRLRHLPHHDETGALDLPHLRAPWARRNQVKWLDRATASTARRHLEAHRRAVERGLDPSDSRFDCQRPGR
jgi:hypothetical protein